MTKAIIIDANMFGDDMREDIQNAINNNGLKVIASKGSKLDQELFEAFSKRYAEYKRTGKFLNICSESVERKLRRIKKKASLKSNDDHIIAIAIVSCANTLATNEKRDLVDDFRDVQRINREAGCITSNCLGSKSDQKVIRKSSPAPSELRRMIQRARAPSIRCECMINGGGCVDF